MLAFFGLIALIKDKGSVNLSMFYRVEIKPGDKGLLPGKFELCVATAHL